MTEIFLTADTHFGHAKILGFEPGTRGRFNCIEEHDEFLIDQWNSVVRPRDSVWHLGDVALGQAGRNTMRRLNGYKRLVLGNHDTYDSQFYLDSGFAQLFGSVSFKGIALLTHVPMHPGQLEYRFRFNFHGHLHGGTTIDDERYINVGTDHWGLKPVAWSELRKIVEERL